MFFDDWQDQKYQHLQISKHLLWDQNIKEFDYQKSKKLVVQRVIERGWFDDIYAMIRIYGGIENIRNIIKEIPILSERDQCYVCAVFKLKKEELLCSTWRESRQKPLNS